MIKFLLGEIKMKQRNRLLILIIFFLLCAIIIVALLLVTNNISPIASKTSKPNGIAIVATEPGSPTAKTETVSENPDISYTIEVNCISDNISLSNTVSDPTTKKESPMPDRVLYQTGFFYESLSDSIKSRITGISYPVENSTITYEDLRYVSVLHYDFNGKVCEGELICSKDIAEDLVEIFYDLYLAAYPIEKICFVDEYGGDDTLSMLDNNTSSFNYRVVDGSTTLSKHALGLAIDINPFYNPYVTYPDNVERISPPGSEPYANRSENFIAKISHDDLCYKLFQEHGFTWGGDWIHSKDYQHFQKK